MAAGAGIKLTGDKELLRKLRTLGPRVQRKVVRTAVRKAARPIIRGAKRNCTVSRRLKKSIGQRVRTYTASGVVLAIVGPRRGYKMKGRRRVGPDKFKGIANIAHLIEFGHRIVRGGALKRSWKGVLRGDKKGNVVGHVPARPFMRPAWDAGKGKAMSIVQKELAVGIEKEARKKG